MVWSVHTCLLPTFWPIDNPLCIPACLKNVNPLLVYLLLHILCSHAGCDFLIWKRKIKNITLWFSHIYYETLQFIHIPNHRMSGYLNPWPVANALACEFQDSLWVRASLVQWFICNRVSTILWVIRVSVMSFWSVYIEYTMGQVQRRVPTQSST